MKVIYDGEFKINIDGQEKLFSEVHPGKLINIMATEIEIKNTTKIKLNSFREFENLTKITISESVTTIYNTAFFGCCNLSEIYLPNTLEYIGASAFGNCISLKKIEIPDNVSEIKSDCFSKCLSLESVKLPNKLEKLERDTFESCTALKEIILPDSIADIDDRVFYNCKSLEKVTFSKNLTHIGFACFSNCLKLKNIDLPNSVQRLENEAFYNCPNLASANVNCNIETLGSSIFGKCEKLKTVNLSDNIKTIMPSAFVDCHSLKYINLPKNIKKINYTSFVGCDLLDDKTYKNIALLSARDINDWEINLFINTLNIDIHNSEFMQELMAVNPILYDTANDIDQEVFLDAILDGIKRIYTNESLQTIIETDLCKIKKLEGDYYLCANEDINCLGYKVTFLRDIQKIYEACYNFSRKKHNEEDLYK